MTGPYVLLAKVLAVLGLAGALVAGYHWWADAKREEGRQEVRAEWAVERQQQTTAALDAAQANAREGFRRLERQAAIEQRKSHEIATLHDRVAGLLDQLRQRPDRPAAAGGGSAQDPAVAKACTGAELYRPDAEFLVREAARAQRVLLERDACHDKYDALTVKP